MPKRVSKNQLPLFGVVDHCSQQEQLTRVSAKIGGVIIRFFSDKSFGFRFHMKDLLTAVRSEFPYIAPDSPSRVMRDLRQKSVIDYRVINRKNSLYEITSGRRHDVDNG